MILSKINSKIMRFFIFNYKDNVTISTFVLITSFTVVPYDLAYTELEILLLGFSTFLLWFSTLCICKLERNKHIAAVFSMLSMWSVYAYAKSVGSFDLYILLYINVIFLSLFLIVTIFLDKLEFVGRVISTLIVFFITLIISVLTIYYKTTGIITEDVIYALLQSNLHESVEFISDFVRIRHLLILFSPPIITLAFIIILIRSKHNPSPTRLRLFLVVLLSISIIILIPQQASSDFSRIGGYFDNYHKELSTWKEALEKRKVDHVDFKAETSSKGRLHVVVIGESLSRYHMSAYGYPVKTTPWIEASKPIIFEKAYSSHVHTMQVLSQSLTSANQYNNSDFFTSHSIIEIANLAGYKTSWFSNQIKLGQWDNLVSVLSESSDFSKYINSSNIGKTADTKYLDKALLPEIKKYLQSSNKEENRVLFVHMMGSHASYCNRTKGEKIKIKYPKSYVFKGKESRCYDKSVKYTDEFLEELYAIASSTQGFTSMTFFSDHGDDVFERLGHNSANFTEYMAEVPLLIWQKNDVENDTFDNLRSNRNKYFTNDLIFELLLDILDIETENYDPTKSIANVDYNLSSPLTLHGEVDILDSNFNRSAKNISLNSNFMAHRVNTIGSMYDARRLGFSQIEVDVLYDSKTGDIVIGHDSKSLSGMSLDKYLSFENGNFSRIWIDFKNLNNKNIESVFDALRSLDRKFALKDRVLLETSFKGDALSMFSKDGWFTSYYVPTKITKNYSRGNPETEILVNAIKDQISRQGLSSLSFDYRVYQFIINGLGREYLDNSGVKLNSWLYLNAADVNFVDKIESYKLVNDPLVESIIIQYPTRFRL